MSWKIKIPALLFFLLPLALSALFFRGAFLLPIALGAIPLAILLHFWRKRQIGAFTAAAALSLLSLLILLRSGIFENTIPTFADTPYHYYNAWLVDSFLLPNFQGLVGYNPFFQAGHQKLYDFPPLFSLLVSAIKLVLGLPLHQAFRTAAALSFLALPLAACFFSRRFLGLPMNSAFLSGLLVLLSRHHTFENGVFSVYLSAALFLLGGGVFRKNPKAAFLLFGLSLSAHPTIFASMAILFALLLLFLGEAKGGFFSLLLPGMGILLLVSSPYLSLVLEGALAYSNAWKNLPLTSPELYNLSSGLLFELSRRPLEIGALILCFGLLALRPKAVPKELRAISLSSALLFLAISLVGLLQGAGISQANFLVTERMAFSLGIALSLLAGAAFVELTKQGESGLPELLACFALAYSLLFYLSYLSLSWNCPACTGLFDRTNSNGAKGIFQNWYPSLSPTSGIFSSEGSSDIFAAMSFVSKRTNSSESRVLLESSKRSKYGGWLIPLAAPVYGLNSIGGPTAQMNLDASLDANAYDGVLLGRNISDYSDSELSEAFLKMNLQYAIVNSNEAILRLSESPGLFREELSTPGHRVFLFLNSSKNYASPEAAASGKLSGDGTRLDVRLNRPSSGEGILVKMRFSRNLRGVSDSGKEISLAREEGGIMTIARFPLGESGGTIEFEPPLLTRVSPLLALLGIAAALFPLGRNAA